MTAARSNVSHQERRVILVCVGVPASSTPWLRYQRWCQHSCWWQRGSGVFPIWTGGQLWVLTLSSWASLILSPSKKINIYKGQTEREWKMQISSSIADTQSCAHVLRWGRRSCGGSSGRSRGSPLVQLKAVKGQVGATSVRRNRIQVNMF